MVIVRLQGGLGNQMFQYACGRALALRRSAELRLDLHLLFDRQPRNGFTFREYALHPFRIQQSFASEAEINRVRAPLSERVIARLQRRPARWLQQLQEPQPGPVLDEMFHGGGDLYLDGYWQSHEYFANAEDVIRREFILWDEPRGRAAELKRRIACHEAVCVHVRRGDFVGDQTMGTCGIELYFEAARRLRETVRQPRFYLFSDDPEWCRRHLAAPLDAAVVDSIEYDANPHWCQHLMSCCRHFVISNSTFSWWAAYLSPHPAKQVILPRKWFQDDGLNQWSRQLIAEGWVAI